MTNKPEHFDNIINKAKYADWVRKVAEGIVSTRDMKTRVLLMQGMPLKMREDIYKKIRLIEENMDDSHK